MSLVSFGPKDSLNFVPGNERDVYTDIIGKPNKEFELVSKILLDCRRLSESTVIKNDLRDQFDDTLWHSLCLGLTRTIYAHSPAIDKTENLKRYVKSSLYEFCGNVAGFAIGRCAAVGDVDLTTATQLGLFTVLFKELYNLLAWDTKIAICESNAKFLVKRLGIDGAHVKNKAGTTAAMLAARFNLLSSGWSHPNPLLVFIVQNSSLEQLKIMLEDTDNNNYTIFDYACSNVNNTKYLLSVKRTVEKISPAASLPLYDVPSVSGDKKFRT